MDLLFIEALGKPLWMWLAFIVLITALLAFDLGVLHRKAHEIGVRESLLLSAFYIGLGLGFAGWVWHLLGEQAALLYLTGFIVEKSLAMDNIFVIAMIFTYFATPRHYQHRVLVYGILGVVVLRAIMIGAGAAIVSQFEWVLYLFAAFLIFTGIKMLVMGGGQYDVSANPVLQLLRKRLLITDQLHGQRFFVRLPHPDTGRVALYATPLFLALATVEIADVIFAIDSIPAIFAITTDTYIVYTSNIFAILGLRALYFALAAMIHRFVYLRHALAAVLVFIGGKIFVADMLDLAKVPPAWSLSVTLIILAAGILGSLWKTGGGAAPDQTVRSFGTQGRTAIRSDARRRSPETSAAAARSEAHPRPLSRVIVELAETAGKRVSMGELTTVLSDRSFAALIILFAAPNLLPLPPGSSTIFGIPLILIASQLLVGRSRLWLPRILRERSIDKSTFSGMAAKVEPILRRLERLARPRYWPMPSVRAERFVGLVVLLMALILVFPIPFGNWAPAVAAILVSLALSERDGVWLACGALVAAGSLGLAAGVVGSIGFAASGLLE